MAQIKVHIFERGKSKVIHQNEKFGECCKEIDFLLEHKKLVPKNNKRKVCNMFVHKMYNMSYKVFPFIENRQKTGICLQLFGYIGNCNVAKNCICNRKTIYRLCKFLSGLKFRRQIKYILVYNTLKYITCTPKI